MSGIMRGFAPIWQTSWVTDPPVISVPQGPDFEAYVTKLGVSLTGFMPNEPRSTPFDPNDWAAWVVDSRPGWRKGGQALKDDPKLRQYRNNPSGFQDSWDKRLLDGNLILGMMGGGKDINLVYVLFGNPVGLLCMNDGDPAYVGCVATHPGAGDAGATLIEAAVAASSSGKLELSSLSVAESFYKKLGFVDGPGGLTLTPAAPIWTNAGDRWRLSQYAGQGYMTTTKRVMPPLPPPPPPKG